MDTSGQAAEQVVRYSLEGIEYALKVTGASAERITAALMAIAKGQEQTKGKSTLHKMLKSGRELTVFTIPEKRLKEFAGNAKHYGVLYCAIKDKQNKRNGTCDLLVRAEDAARLSRIIERMGLNQVTKTAPEPEPDTLSQEVEQAEELLDQILTPMERENSNPISARTEPSSQSEPISEPEAATEIVSPNQKPSVRAALAQIRMEQQQNPLMQLGKDTAVQVETTIQMITEEK